MFLIDTNVVSEARKGRKADPGVRRWLKDHPDDLYLPVQVIGELRQGVERIRARGDGAQAALLHSWLERVLQDYDDRIIDFDADGAQVWGALMGLQPQHPIDKQIAAVALLHDLIVVTRNTGDFEGTGVQTFDPFDR